MTFNALLSTNLERLPMMRAPEPVVLSTRIRLARNLCDRPFPGWAKPAQRRDILSVCEGAVAAAHTLSGGTVLSMEELTELQKQILVERHLVSRELAGKPVGSAVVISADQAAAVMINEEDHLRIQFLRSGYDLPALWEAINALDSELEQKLDYAFDPHWGYLTACPTNLGTGLRASIMMHLPGMVLGGHMEKVVRALGQKGMVVRGLYGEGSDTSGSIFQISNQQTLGQSEEEIVRELQRITDAMITQERNARLCCLEKDPAKFCDRIGRAYGLLTNAHVLNSAEAMNCLSLIRLAVDMGALPQERRADIDAWFIESQPGHVQYRCGDSADPQSRDVARATFLREQMKGLGPIRLDKLALS